MHKYLNDEAKSSIDPCRKIVGGRYCIEGVEIWHEPVV